MAKFSTSEKINRSIDRAQKRRAAMDAFVEGMVAQKQKEYTEKYGDAAGVYPYMTGYLQSFIGTLAQCETIAEMRRAVRYSTGVTL